MRKQNFAIALRVDEKTKSALDFIAGEWAVTASEAIRRAVIATASTELKREPMTEGNDSE